MAGQARTPARHRTSPVASSTASARSEAGPGRAAANRLAILRAAEQCFASEGIDGVSLRTINRIAAQGNASAVQYHFGGRAGLVRAVLARHQATTDPLRHARLDEYEAAGPLDARDLARALVLPLATKLDDRDGGRDYLRVACEFYSRAESLEDLGPEPDPTSSMARWHAVAQAWDPQQRDGELPTRYAAVRLALSELARRAANPRHRRHELFTSHLVDMVEAVLEAAASAETRRFAADRARQRRSRPR
jgi:AcrR family transcriptional regulator